MDISPEVRAAFADELEDPKSPLCDCDPENNKPTSPLDRRRMAHHCDCAAVVASTVIRKGQTVTLHDRDCGLTIYDQEPPPGVSVRDHQGRLWLHAPGNEGAPWIRVGAEHGVEHGPATWAVVAVGRVRVVD